MSSDLHRYLFCACFAESKNKSPRLGDFPPSLLPKHKNADSGNFKDRFRTLIKDKPSWTVLSHLAKDGHSFIHPDPIQCRSITPREAARIQTFPDNYFFFGGRSAIFKQIGNAVPPWLARLIAESLVGVLNQ
jgi:DNA (cytosine-5)-methyltransferase 1